MKFKELVSPSLKDLFVSQIENMILQGEVSIGEQLPIERDLAKQMKVSRSIINNGMQELADKGFVKIIPRQGIFIEDYVRNGNIKTLVAIMDHKGSHYDKALLESFIEFRRDIETLCSQRASLNRTQEQLQSLNEKFGTLKNTAGKDEFIDELLEFHKLIYISTCNFVYPLLFNAFYDVLYKVSSALLLIFDHGQLVDNLELVLKNIQEQNEEGSYQAMLCHVDVCAEALKNHFKIH